MEESKGTRGELVRQCSRCGKKLTDEEWYGEDWWTEEGDGGTDWFCEKCCDIRLDELWERSE